MWNWKKAAGIVLALAMMTGTLSGCAAQKDASGVSSASSSQASSSEASSAVSAAQAAETFDYGKGLDENGLFEGVKALDYVKLPDYKNLEVPGEELDVSDGELQAEIDAALQEYASTQQVKDREVKDGDTVNIDYVGSVDGVEFEGGNTGGNGATVTIGVTNYIDDFLQQLIGHKPGETIDVNVTFPEPYENDPDLSGKDALFVTTINYIEETVTPELTDELVAEHWQESDGWSTVAQLRDGMREQMKKDAGGEYLWNKILEESEVSEMPQVIQTYQVENMKHYYTAMASQYNMELEEFLTQYIGVEDMDALEEQNRSTLESNAKVSLLLQALCENEEFSVSDEAMEAYFREISPQTLLSELEDFYGRPYLLLLAREALIREALGELAISN